MSQSLALSHQGHEIVRLCDKNFQVDCVIGAVPKIEYSVNRPYEGSTRAHKGNQLYLNI